MTILESITLLEGNTKGSVIKNMGKYRAHKNVVGAMYLEGVYVPFHAWAMGLWNSMCVLASSEQENYELLVNSQSVFLTLQYQGQHRPDISSILIGRAPTLLRSHWSRAS